MFESAHLKLDWANHHVADLKSIFDSFVKAHRYTFIVGNDPNTGEITVELHFKEQIPTSLSMILADAIHNLRTSLDHATWELIGLDGGTQDRWTSFPTESNQREYESSCNGIKTPRDDTKKFLVELATYKGGAGGKSTACIFSTMPRSNYHHAACCSRARATVEVHRPRRADSPHSGGIRL